MYGGKATEGGPNVKGVPMTEGGSFPFGVQRQRQGSEDLETVIQSEVNQKEKNKYRILMHICGIYKNGTDELVCKAEIETQM